MKSRIYNLFDVLTLLLVLAGAALPDVNAQNTITVGTEKVTALPSLVQVGVDLDIDVDLSALSLEVIYDPTILEISTTDVLSSNDLIQAGISPLVTQGNDRIIWSVLSPFGTAIIHSGTGRLFTMNFMVNDSLGSTTSLALANISATSTTSTPDVPLVKLDGEIIGLSQVILSESGETTEIVENGSSDTYSLVLNTQPGSEVTVTIQSDAQVQTDLNQVTFTDSNWAFPQEITVTAIDDAVSEGPHVGVLMHATMSSDSEYDELHVASVNAQIKDNDGISVGFAKNSSATLDESDASHSVAVRLSLPSGNALPGPVRIEVVDLATGTGQVDQDYSTFGAQSVTFPVDSIDGDLRMVNLGILDDAVDEENQTIVLQLQSVSGANLGIQDEHIVTITDDDTAGVEIIESDLSTRVEEGGAMDTYTINLTSEPSADVVITLNGSITDLQLAVNPLSVTFTPSDWDTPQEITVSAIDDDVFEGFIHAGTIAHSFTSLNPLYNNIALQKINAQITENDTLENILSIDSVSAPGLGLMVQVPVNLSVNRDLKFFTMNIIFDPMLLELGPANIIPSADHFFEGGTDQITVSVDGEKGIISWSVDNLSGEIPVIKFGTGLLFTVEFTITNAITDQTVISLSSIEASDSMLNSLSLVTENGAITGCEDSDMDTLCDNWETDHFADLRFGKSDDPDHDGVSNQDEFEMGTDPFVLEVMLNVGWNLFSISVQPQANSVTQIFGDAIGSPVWTWNAQNQQNEVTVNVSASKGYWVYSKTDRQNENAILINLP